MTCIVALLTQFKRESCEKPEDHLRGAVISYLWYPESASGAADILPSGSIFTRNCSIDVKVTPPPTGPESELCQTLRFNDIVSVDLLHANIHENQQPPPPSPVCKGHFVRLMLWRLRVKFTVGTGNNARSSFSSALSVQRGSDTRSKVPWEVLAYFSSAIRRKESVQLIDGRAGGPVGADRLVKRRRRKRSRSSPFSLNTKVKVSASFACGRVSRLLAADEASSGLHEWPKFLWNFQ